MTPSHGNGTPMRLTKDIIIVVVGLSLLLLMAFPFLWVVVISFRPEADIFTRTFQLITTFTTENYALLVEKSPFATYLRNSFFVCTVATVAAVVIALIAAFFGFSGIAGSVEQYAKLMFFIFLLIALISIAADTFYFR